MIHEIPLQEDTVHGYFSSALPPVLMVDPGDSVRFQSLNAGWRWDSPEEHFERDAKLHDGHALTGPIEVRGARAGQTLVVQIDEVTPRSWGATFAHEELFLWSIDGDTATDDRGVTVALAPFLGVIGMPPPEPACIRPSRRAASAATSTASCSSPAPRCISRSPSTAPCSRPATATVRRATARSRAPPSSVRSSACSLTLDVRDDLDLRTPIARTADAWITFGFDEDLDLAAESSMATMLDLMERELGFERTHALALSSVVVDLHVTQIVNVTKGVHAVLRDDALGAAVATAPVLLT